MSKFYLTDPNIINAALTDKEFRIYNSPNEQKEYLKYWSERSI